MEQKSESIAEKLLEALDDEAVAERLGKIVKTAFKDEESELYAKAKGENDALRQRIAQTERKSEEYKKNFADLYEQNGRLTKRYGALEKEYGELLSQRDEQKARADRLAADCGRLSADNGALSVKLSSAEDNLRRYEEAFSAAQRHYFGFLSLSEDTRSALSGIICSRSPVEFIASCADMNNLDRLWDYIKNMLSNDAPPVDIQVLSDVFGYFFTLKNGCSYSPVYLPDDTKPGDEYDDEKHTRAKGSSVRGVVTRICLRGYYSAATGKYIKKSVVIAQTR